jgi:hypothetical protein
MTEQLKQLALAAASTQSSVGWHIAHDMFTDAASPDVVLALIADIDMLAGELNAMKDWKDAMRDNADLRRDEVLLKVMQDAERYRWLRKYLSTKDFSILTQRGQRDEPDERDAIDDALDWAQEKRP